MGKIKNIFTGELVETFDDQAAGHFKAVQILERKCRELEEENSTLKNDLTVLMSIINDITQLPEIIAMIDKRLNESR